MEGVIVRHGDADVSANGRPLLQLCCNNALCIMNTFFQHRDAYKCTWWRDSLGQRSLIDFCTVSADLFWSVMNVHVKRKETVDRSEPSTDHHLLVRNLHLEKAPGPIQTCRTSSRSYRIKPWWTRM